MNTHDNQAVLREAKALIQKYGWTKCSMARTSDQENIAITSEHASTFCLAEACRLALIRVEGHTSDRRCAIIEGLVLAAIERREGGPQRVFGRTIFDKVANWNDARHRLKAHVVSVLTSAIRVAGQQ